MRLAGRAFGATLLLIGLVVMPGGFTALGIYAAHKYWRKQRQKGTR